MLLFELSCASITFELLTVPSLLPIAYASIHLFPVDLRFQQKKERNKGLAMAGFDPSTLGAIVSLLMDKPTGPRRPTILQKVRELAEKMMVDSKKG